MRTVATQDMALDAGQSIAVREGSDKYGKGEPGTSPVVLDEHWTYQCELKGFSTYR